MKRILMLLLTAAVLPVMAQTPAVATRASAKPGSTAPMPAPKRKNALLTREELRACFQRQVANATENVAVSDEAKAFNQEHADLLTAKAALEQQIETLKATATVILADEARLTGIRQSLANPAADADAAALELQRTAFNNAASAYDQRVTSYNSTRQSLAAIGAQLDQRIGASNLRASTVKARAAAYAQAVEDWRLACADKRFDADDEIAIKNGL